jgi:catechol-2,3-dioxygenase
VIDARFGHVHLIARDWRRLADFYERVFGGVVGEVVTTGTSNGRRVTWTYLTDPEGNILELQSWSEPVTE